MTFFNKLENTIDTYVTYKYSSKARKAEPHKKRVWVFLKHKTPGRVRYHRGCGKKHRYYALWATGGLTACYVCGFGCRRCATEISHKNDIQFYGWVAAERGVEKEGGGWNEYLVAQQTRRCSAAADWLVCIWLWCQCYNISADPFYCMNISDAMRLYTN